MLHTVSAVRRSKKSVCYLFIHAGLGHLKTLFDKYILRSGNYFVFDYGSANDQYFNAISFIEKDIPIIVCGSSPSEWDSTNAVIAKMLLHDAYYIFNFCDKSEHQEILDLMQEKAKKTIFSDYAPDFSLFTADRNNLYKQIIKLENLSVSKPAKKGLFNWKRNKSYGKV